MTGFFQVTSACTQPEIQRTTPQPLCCLLILQPTSSIQLQKNPPKDAAPVWEMWKPLQILGKSRRLSAASPHPGSRKLQKMGVEYGFLHQLPPAGLFLVHLPFFNIYKVGAGVSASLKKIRFLRALFPCLTFYSHPSMKGFLQVSL